MGETISIRPLTSFAEMVLVEEIQRRVWHFPDLEIVPAAHLAAAVGAGGCLLGAFDGSEMIGFVYGFGGIEHGTHAHHSHMLAVLSEYRNRDLGRRLKFAQKEFVAAMGINLMSWTYDPLQCTNAYFNFHKLGAFSSEYFINFYGEEAGSPLHQTGTDRLWMQWELNRSEPSKTIREPEALQSAISVGGGEHPVEKLSVIGSQSRILLEIPRDINAIQRREMSLAIDWRSATRKAFVDAFEKGYVAVDFIKQPPASLSGGAYVLELKQAD